MLDRDEQLKVSSTGLKLFERQEAKVSFLPFLKASAICTCHTASSIRSSKEWVALVYVLEQCNSTIASQRKN